MLKWEYCILSGIETSVRKRLSLSLAFSNRKQDNQCFELELDSDHNEETFTTRYLGELGESGWEVVAFNRAAARFEAVLKRPLDLNSSTLSVTSQMNQPSCGDDRI